MCELSIDVTEVNVLWTFQCQWMNVLLHLISYYEYDA